jgi:hypothetical protein
VTGLDAGAAWWAIADVSGVVRGVFSRAIHLQFADTLVVIVGRDEPSGPLHLRLDQLPVVAERETVKVAGSIIRLGDAATIDVARVQRWTPAVPASTPRWHSLPGADRSSLGGERHLLAGITDLLRADDLAGVVRELSGRGQGLTPAGDDVLAGIMITLHAFGVTQTELTAALAESRTTDLAAAYLAWAARGQCIQPAHDLLDALARGDESAIAATQDVLLQHGASSGADLMLGIRLALSLWTDGVRTDAVPTRQP